MTTKPVQPEMPICGVIRPIAAIEGWPTDQWNQVQSQINKALGAKYRVRVVSESPMAGIIQGNIVDNLFSDDIVVCDVSAKNTNVMLELGMRLAFDKPVVVIKDDATTFSFDTSPIQHLPYPKSLRVNEMDEFRDLLLEKVTATLAASKEPGYKSYLSHFGAHIKAATINPREVSLNDIVLDELAGVKAMVSNMALSLSRVMRPMTETEQLKSSLIPATKLKESSLASMLSSYSAFDDPLGGSVHINSRSIKHK